MLFVICACFYLSIKLIRFVNRVALYYVETICRYIIQYNIYFLKLDLKVSMTKISWWFFNHRTFTSCWHFEHVSHKVMMQLQLIYIYGSINIFIQSKSMNTKQRAAIVWPWSGSIHGPVVAVSPVVIVRGVRVLSGCLDEVDAADIAATFPVEGFLLHLVRETRGAAETMRPVTRMVVLDWPGSRSNTAYSEHLLLMVSPYCVLCVFNFELEYRRII